MNQKRKAIIIFIMVALASGLGYFTYIQISPPTIQEPAPLPQTEQEIPLEYRNTEYGFVFSLPRAWEGYSIIASTWEGYTIEGEESGVVATGTEIILRHPQWTSENLRQDIPIMVLTISQWNALQREAFHIGAAPIGPSELARNATHVFALPARYNYAFPAGFEEVEKILQGNPLYTLR